VSVRAAPPAPSSPLFPSNHKCSLPLPFAPLNVSSLPFDARGPPRRFFFHWTPAAYDFNPLGPWSSLSSPISFFPSVPRLQARIAEAKNPLPPVSRIPRSPPLFSTRPGRTSSHLCSLKSGVKSMSLLSQASFAEKSNASRACVPAIEGEQRLSETYSL